MLSKYMDPSAGLAGERSLATRRLCGERVWAFLRLKVKSGLYIKGFRP